MRNIENLVNDAYFSKQAEPHIKAKRKAGRFDEQISIANDDIIHRVKANDVFTLSFYN